MFQAAPRAMRACLEAKERTGYCQSLPARRGTARFGFADCGKAKIEGTRNLACVLTVRAGKAVFDPSGLTMPPWREAPPAYWVMPELQT